MNADAANGWMLENEEFRFFRFLNLRPLAKISG